jgi:hypothetical protein
LFEEGPKAVAFEGWTLDEALSIAFGLDLSDQSQSKQTGYLAEPAFTDVQRSALVDALFQQVGDRIIVFERNDFSRQTGREETLCWTELDRTTAATKLKSNERTDVRFFPLLRSPDAIDRLLGRSLAEVFERFVVGDLEIQSRLKRNRIADYFTNDPLGRRSIWPVVASAGYFRMNMASVREVVSWTSDSAASLCAAMADRWGALLSLLSSGKIQATGFSKQWGQVPIPRLQWKRPGYFVDGINGDLCEFEEDPVPIWSGIEFISPASVSLPGVNLSDKPKKAKSPHGQDVERIIRQHRIDALQVGRKAAAGEVAKYLSDPPQSANELKALEMLVWRTCNEVYGRN